MYRLPTRLVTLIVTTMLFITYAATAQSGFAPKNSDTARDQRWNLHTQLTTVTQHNFGFAAKYAGQNSLLNTPQTETSVTATFFAGVRLWRGAAVYINPELSGGAGLSSTLGVAGFPNGETFRVGREKPEVYLARGFLQQYIALGSDTETQDDEANAVRMRIPKKYIRLTAGKFSVADFFDVNEYAHDARTLFLNWSLMSHGAWDYPANVKGYTYGFVGEWTDGVQFVRAAYSMPPTDANGPELDPNIALARSFTAEYDRTWTHDGAKLLRTVVTAFHTTTHMGNYAAATALATPDITAVRAEGRTKYGFGVSLEREILTAAAPATSHSYVFLKGSWNDGANETWAFTEIDRSLAAGVSLAGNHWKRPDDRFGFAYVQNNISQAHADYLAAGGYGFIIGDGALHYAPEHIIEAYYSFRLTNWCWVTPDAQLIINPAYNTDRGPVPVVAIRIHTEM